MHNASMAALRTTVDPTATATAIATLSCVTATIELLSEVTGSVGDTVAGAGVDGKT